MPLKGLSILEFYYFVKYQGFEDSMSVELEYVKAIG